MPDKLIKGISIKSKIRFTYVDVTVSAKALEARHLSGPTAGMVLAEALAAAALLSSDTSSEDESVSMQIKVSGPLGGLVVEAMNSGGLRGYTNVKVINELDGYNTINSSAALGEQGSASIIKSLPGKVLNQAQFDINPPSIRTILARFFNHSMQIPTAAEINVVSDTSGLISARGITAERMPDGDHDVFIRILERFEDGSVKQHLNNSPDLQSLARVLELNDISEKIQRSLLFACRCSRNKAEQILTTLPDNELLEMINDGKSHVIHCHMCGEDYSIPPEIIKKLLADKKTS